jgi:hypothetical protein
MRWLIMGAVALCLATLSVWSVPADAATTFSWRITKDHSAPSDEQGFQ